MHKTDKVLILPMRDWNEVRAEEIKFLSRFDLTYEGLKHESGKVLIEKELSFDLTYEGLKRII